MRILLLFFVLSFNFVYGQSINCDEILNKQPNFIKKSSKSTKSRLAEDIKILKNCGDFKDADSIFLPILGAQMIRNPELHKALTYGKMILMFRAIKNDDAYKNLLLTAELNKGNSKAIAKRFEFKPLVSVEQAIADGKIANKKLLIFFTGYSCVNGVRMEEQVFVDPKVKSTLTANFVCLMAHVDDMTALPNNEQYFSKALNLKVNTIGRRFLDLQKSRFKADRQPYIVVLNTNGKIIKQFEDYQDKQKFLSFIRVK